MSVLIMESLDNVVITPKSMRPQPLSTWFHFLNFATIAVVCLVLLKIYRGLSVTFKWFFSSGVTAKNPIILVIGPKNDIIRDIIRQLAHQFKSELVDLKDLKVNISDNPRPISRSERSILLYTHAPVTSQIGITELHTTIESTFDNIDVLVIAQNENPIQRDSTHSFLSHLNKELLQQFWTVMAFLPGMLRRNRGHIISIELDRSSLINTGVMRTVYEDLLQSDTKVKLTLIERNTFMENFLPPLSTNTIARLIIRSMWNSNSIVRVPSMSAFLLLLPETILRLLMRQIFKLINFNLS